jgi:hypothetical protein
MEVGLTPDQGEGSSHILEKKMREISRFFIEGDFGPKMQAESGFRGGEAPLLDTITK